VDESMRPAIVLQIRDMYIRSLLLKKNFE